ncbi:endolysin [Butyrivibrio virus Bo-Finn]|nr:endolysin [Butyrivibrio virus Bo-Finn]
MKTIIDISKHNGAVDWERVKKSGVDGVILRCGFGQDEAKQDDSRFKENADACTRLNIPFGIYIYSYARTVDKVAGEAAHIIRLANGYNLALPLFYDLEEHGTEATAAERANRYLQIIKDAGYIGGIYASEYWFKKYLTNVDTPWKWVAKYGMNTGTAGTKPDVSNVDIWQYTSRGIVNGISGRVDMSILYRGFIGDQEPQKTVKEIATEVIANKWGTGAERVQRLTDAGYNAEQVQAMVNDIIKKQEAPKAAVEEAPKAAEDKPNTYTVQAGDTLGKIAKAHHTTVAKLCEINSIKDKNKIKTGQIIRVK